MPVERSDDVDVAFLDDSDVDVHTVATDGPFVQVDGEPTPVAVEDFDVSVDSDLERVRDAVVDREQFDREYSFSIEFDLDPTDPDDRDFATFLARLFGGE